MEADSID